MTRSSGHDLIDEAEQLRNLKNKKRMRAGGVLLRMAIGLYEVGGAICHELALLRRAIEKRPECEVARMRREAEEVGDAPD